jgi:hypothetical protein
MNRNFMRSALRAAAIAGASAALLSCELGPDDTTDPMDQANAALEAAAQEKPCDPESVADLIEVIEALSEWDFDDTCIDKAHPDYCKIVQATFESLERYLEQGFDKIVNAKTQICIKNGPHPNGHGAYTDVLPGGGFRITHYTTKK